MYIKEIARMARIGKPAEVKEDQRTSRIGLRGLLDDR
jgi:hypothetical protein